MPQAREPTRLATTRPAHQPPDVGQLRRVGARHAHGALRPRLPQPRAVRLRHRAAARREHNRGGPARGQPPARQQAEPAGAAREQMRVARRRGGGGGDEDDHLAGVCAGLQAAERGEQAALQPEALQWQPVQHARRRARRQPLECAPHPHRRLLDRAVERDRHVARKRRAPQPLRTPHRALADLAQAAALAQQRKRASDEVGGQAVEHEAQPRRADERRRAGEERAAVARAERLAAQTHAMQIPMLVRPADRHACARADPMCVLARCEANATGARLQQRVVARARPRREERHVNRAPRRRQGARLLDRQRVVDRRHQPRVAPRKRCQRRQAMAEHSVAHAQVRRAAAAASHVCSAVAAGRTGVAGVHAEDVEHVAEVETDRSHAQLDLAVRGRGALLGLRHDPEVRHRAARVEVHPNRPAD